MSKRNSELIDDRLSRVMKAGETPYQANRRALKALDIDGNIPKGDKELKTVLASIGFFTKELEGLANVSDAVVRGLSSGVH